MRRLALVLLLAGCAAADVPSPRPAETVARSVTLFRDTVTVTFTDGTLCTGVRPGADGAWSGRLAGCPHTWGFEVTTPTQRPRLPLAPAASAPWVVLTGPGGTQGYAPPAAPSS